MHAKALISAIAVVAAIGFTPALAQDAEKTINGMVIPQSDALLVQDYCDNLAQAELGVDVETTQDTAAVVNNDNSTDAGATSGQNQSELGAATSALQIDFDSITLATCKEGGWIQ